MKNRGILLCFAVLLAFLLVACGTVNDIAASTEVEIETAEETEEKIEDETEAVEEVTAEPELTETEEADSMDEEIQAVAQISYEDFNISGYGYDNFIDLYGAGNGINDAKRVSIMNPGCAQYSNFPDELSTATQTSRGIKLGDSRETVIATYGEPSKEVVYMNKNYQCDGLDPQYNLCYFFIDERYPEVFFNLSFNMDQNDNVMVVSYDAILMKWYN